MESINDPIKAVINFQLITAKKPDQYLIECSNALMEITAKDTIYDPIHFSEHIPSKYRILYNTIFIISLEYALLTNLNEIKEIFQHTTTYSEYDTLIIRFPNDNNIKYVGKIISHECSKINNDESIYYQTIFDGQLDKSQNLFKTKYNEKVKEEAIKLKPKNKYKRKITIY